MEIPLSRLKPTVGAPVQIPPRVEPRLPLGEELALLTADCEKNNIADIIRLCGDAYGQPLNYRQALESLERAGMITRKGLMHHVLPTDAACTRQRWRRVLPLIRSVAELADRDGDLLVGLAAGGALTLSIDDHLRARHRIGSLGHTRPLTRFVELAYDRFEVTTGHALAEAVLPPERSFKPGDFDTGLSVALLAAYNC